VDRQIATYVQGRHGKDSAAPLTLRILPAARLPQRARSEACSIPLLESKIEHPERFRMKTLKVPATHADNNGCAAARPCLPGLELKNPESS
jgi:hypothetical protein